MARRQSMLEMHVSSAVVVSVVKRLLGLGHIYARLKCMANIIHSFPISQSSQLTLQCNMVLCVCVSFVQQQPPFAHALRPWLAIYVTFGSNVIFAFILCVPCSSYSPVLRQTAAGMGARCSAVSPPRLEERKFDSAEQDQAAQESNTKVQVWQRHHQLQQENKCQAQPVSAS